MTARDKIEIYATCIGYDPTPATDVTPHHVEAILKMADMYIAAIDARLIREKEEEGNYKRD